MSDAKKVLSVDEMLSTQDIEYTEVEIWGGVVRLGSLSAEEMIEYAGARDEKAKGTAGLRLLVRSLVDVSGNRIGTDDHIERFKKKDQKSILKLINAALDLNGIGQVQAIKNA